MINKEQVFSEEKRKALEQLEWLPGMPEVDMHDGWARLQERLYEDTGKRERGVVKVMWRRLAAAAVILMIMLPWAIFISGENSDPGQVNLVRNPGKHPVINKQVEEISKTSVPAKVKPVEKPGPVIAISAPLQKVPGREISLKRAKAVYSNIYEKAGDKSVDDGEVKTAGIIKYNVRKDSLDAALKAQSIQRSGSYNITPEDLPSSWKITKIR